MGTVPAQVRNKWLFRATPTAVLTLAISACGSVPTIVSESARSGSNAGPIGQCVELFESLDRDTEVAGVRDAGLHRLRGFPYLRSNRFVGSFAGKAEDPVFARAWLSELRLLDSQARRVEMLNLGLKPSEVESLSNKLNDCGDRIINANSHDPQWLEKLRKAAVPADNYSSLHRAIGAYPLAVPFLNAGLSRYRESVREEFARPLEEFDSEAPLWLWRLTGEHRELAHSDSSFLKLREKDFLGRWLLSAEDEGLLARLHAPRFWIETGGEFDLPGAPVHWGESPSINIVDNSAYFRTGYTRFNGKSYLQLSYVIWFLERPAQDGLDPEAGKLDSVIWRVTLDEKGSVILHDTIHSCGCYHFAFPTKEWLKNVRVKAEAPELLLPQRTALSNGRIIVRLESGTHGVQRVLNVQDVPAAETVGYQLKSYHSLLTIPAPKGQSRSLFNERGLVEGTQRLERFWLWVSGIDSPGAMRQWGRHATSFVGRTHFDDAFLLEKVFEPKSSLQPDQ